MLFPPLWAGESERCPPRVMPPRSNLKPPPAEDDKFDWSREENVDLRDPRWAGAPCNGSHTPAAFYKGSPSGSNGHAMWIGCKTCRLRLRYVPTYGATGRYRKSEPLSADVKETVTRLEKEGDLNTASGSNQLKGPAVSLEGAERSLEKKLAEVKQRRQQQQRTTTSGTPSSEKPEAEKPEAEKEASKRNGRRAPRTGMRPARSTAKQEPQVVAMDLDESIDSSEPNKSDERMPTWDQRVYGRWKKLILKVTEKSTDSEV